MLCKNVVVKVAGFAGVQLGAGLSFKYLEWRLLRMKRRFERSTSPALRTAA